MADEIYLKDMQFFGRHGVYGPENELGQRFIVSVTLRCDTKGAALYDDLSLTVNYAEVYDTVKEIVEGPPKRLLETVGATIADRILDRFSSVASVQVRVDKPNAPIAGIFGAVGVLIERP